MQRANHIVWIQHFTHTHAHTCMQRHTHIYVHEYPDALINVGCLQAKIN